MNYRAKRENKMKLNKYFDNIPIRIINLVGSIFFLNIFEIFKNKRRKI